MHPAPFHASVEKALRVAYAAHAGQTRKGLGGAPYFTHPAHVALVLARLGFDDVVVAAALLHDVVEDVEDWTLERVEREFGPDVRAIVAELTEDKSRTWAERKADGVARARTMSPAAATVKAADVLHNVRCLVDDLRAADDSEVVWRAFRGGREGTVAMSVKLVSELERRVDPRLGRALREALDELVDLARER